jgi:hypothetical protein
LRVFSFFFFLIVRNVKSLKDNLLKASSLECTGVNFTFFARVRLRSSLIVLSLAVFVSDNLNEFGLTENLNALVLEHIFDLASNVFIIEGLGVDGRDVLLYHGVFLVIDVAVDTWDGQYDVLRAHSTFKKSLDEGISVKGTSVHNTSGLSTSVGESLHERTSSLQVPVEVRVIN